MDFYPQPTSFDILSTAGAVPVKNEKGELSMQKVKVHRYVSGKRPEYAPESSSDEESADEDFIESRKHHYPEKTESDNDKQDEDHLNENKHIESNDRIDREERSDYENEKELPDDPRLRRLRYTRLRFEHRKVERSDDEEERFERHRMIHEPMVIEGEEQIREARRLREVESSDEDEEEELSDTEIERRRQTLKQKVLVKPQIADEVLEKDEEEESERETEQEESSEYEECTDSEEEAEPRLKPVFVRKKERVTIFEKEKEAIKKKEAEIESKKMAEERRKYTLKLVEDTIRKEVAEKTKLANDIPDLNDVNTDDENDEVEYEAWKVRELKRIKRDKDEREQIERERTEIERLRTMTEEERRAELRSNPKLVTNKAAKGKYKFMQKYYHRGAFYMDKDDDIYKRDFSEATLEDHFDKTILPRVMQVKNFGRSGRTKYTHLVDQDTTHFDSPWISETAQNIKFHSNQAAGCKQVFDRPSKKRK